MVILNENGDCKNESKVDIYINFNVSKKNSAKYLVYKIIYELDIDDDEVVYDKYEIDNDLVKCNIRFNSIQSSSRFYDKLTIDDEVLSVKKELLSDKSDKRVTFDIIPAISASNSEHLDLILLYLQNTRKSGGGYFDNYELESDRKTLIVNYEENISKENILNKKIHNIGTYQLIANLPFDEKCFKKLENYLIIRNIAHKNKEISVTLYSENIVENNEVKKIEFSNIFYDTYVVCFVNDFDIDNVTRRYKRRPKLNGQLIELYEGYETNAIVIKQKNETSKLSVDDVDAYFKDTQESGIEKYLEIKSIDPQIFIVYLVNDDDLKTVLMRKHKICGEEVFVEKFYSTKLIKAYLKKTTKIDLNGKPVIYLLDKTKFNVLCVLISKCGHSLKHFQEYMLNLGILFFKNTNDDTFCMQSNNSSTSTDKFENIINDYIKSFKIVYETFSIEAYMSYTNAHLKLQLICEQLNQKLNGVVLILNIKCVEFYGYKDKLNEAVEFLKQQLNNEFVLTNIININPQVPQSNNVYQIRQPFQQPSVMPSTVFRPIVPNQVQYVSYRMPNQSCPVTSNNSPLYATMQPVYQHQVASNVYFNQLVHPQAQYVLKNNILNSPNIQTTAKPQEQKQIIGEQLYQRIQAVYPQLAGKITGMMLELDNNELLRLLNTPQIFQQRLNEAVNLLKANNSLVMNQQ